MARSVFSRPYQVLVAQYKSKDLEELAQAAAQGDLDFPVARAVPLTDAIGALAELERTRTPKGGKLVIVPSG
jgi:NADPH:quinone reductase-like Zn-dependent oxidoreductase